MAGTDGHSTSPSPSPGDGDDDGSKPPVSLAQDALRASGAMLSGLVGGLALGAGVDWLSGSGPWGLLIGALAGIGAGLWRLLRTAAEIDRRGARNGTSGSEDTPGRDF